MANEAFVLRCYAERESDGTWFAICLDLNLYARAASAKEAQDKLHEIISDYVADVMELPEDERAGLIARPASLRFRLRYSYLLFLAMLGAIFRRRPPSGGSSFRKFDEALPAN